MTIITLLIIALLFVDLKRLVSKPLDKSDSFDIALGLKSYQRQIAGYMANQGKNQSQSVSRPLVIKEATFSNKEVKKAPAKKTYVSANGYLRFKDSGIYVHRWQMEKYLHRRLRPGETVHHLDGNKRNNQIENLRLFSSQAEHDAYHRECQRHCHSWYAYLPDYDRHRSLIFSKA